MSNSAEEEIARDYICFGNQNCTVVVVDATCLERNLNLVYQILEITSNVIVCVNLLDEAKKKGISIDLEKLSSHLGVPVVGVIGQKKKTLTSLSNAIYDSCTKRTTYSQAKIQYLPIIEEAIETLEKDNNLKNSSIPSRWIALKILDNNKKIISSIEKHLNIKINLSKKQNLLKKIFDKYNINFSTIKDKIVSSIVMQAETVAKDVCTFKDSNTFNRDKKIDKILTSKTFGIPIMLLFLGIIFWLTIEGANYPSKLLSTFFTYIEDKLLYLFDLMNSPEWLSNILVLGMYRTLAWIVSVMLPPMAIFFPLFTILEDLGYLPRLAFNLDNYFKKACTSGKQAITMCMGFGCNAAGVVGCRIIDSPREKLLAILTNSFIPCNGRYPFLILISTLFIGSYFEGVFSSLISTLAVLLIIVLGITLSLLVSKLLSKTILKGEPTSFILELPPYRKPQFIKVFIRSIFDRTIFVLGRAIAIAAPAGIVIWLFANININNYSILQICANFLDPFAKAIGLDGKILFAFILGIPANEIVLPIILMTYLSNGTLINIEENASIYNILVQNGWTILTGINVMIFTLLHFPCTTTLLTVQKETDKLKWTLLAFALPTVCGIILCFCTTCIYNLGVYFI